MISHIALKAQKRGIKKLAPAEIRGKSRDDNRFLSEIYTSSLLGGRIDAVPSLISRGNVPRHIAGLMRG
jgi:hypothetical protein